MSALFLALKHYLLIIFYSFTLGPQMPKIIFGHSMVEAGGSLYAIGGDSPGESIRRQKSIYQLSCYSKNCTWNTLNAVLKGARSFTVAIPLMDLCSPN